MSEQRGLAEQFRGHLASSGLIPSGSRGLVAVSGGVDSVVLLDLLVHLSSSLELTLGVGHYNHRIRGEASDMDERFVKALAARFGLSFYRDSLPPQSRGSDESWEAYARGKRYEFLEGVRVEGNFSWIATAHHADDQSETVLMRVIAGSGIEGLRGVQERRNNLVRPLLPFWKWQILEHARERHLQFRDDATNIDTSYERNYVRHEIIPRMLELNPGFPKSVVRLSRNVQELEDFICQELEHRRNVAVSQRPEGEFILDAQLLSKEPMLLQKRLIRMLVSQGGMAGSWRHHVWSELEAFLRGTTTGDILDLPDGWSLLRDRGQFLLGHMDGNFTSLAREGIQFTAKRHLHLSVGPFNFAMDVVSDQLQFCKDPFVEFADYSRLDGRNLQLRLWRPGDRMKPLGLDQYRKVSDMLIDEKVDRFKKKRQFVLICDGEIVWLCGMRLDNRFRVNEGTGEVARLSWNYQGQ